MKDVWQQAVQVSAELQDLGWPRPREQKTLGEECAWLDRTVAQSGRLVRRVVGHARKSMAPPNLSTS